MPIARLLIVLFLLAGALLAPAAPSAAAGGPHRDLALAALSWIAAQQEADGGFPGYSASAAVDAIFAICAVGGDPNGFLREGRSPVTYLAAHAEQLSSDAGTAAKVVLGLVCAGQDPRAFAGRDWLAVVEAFTDPASRTYESAGSTSLALSILALASTGRPLPQAAVSWLVGGQTPEGGWSWSSDPAAAGPDTNSTALALQALAAAGVGPADPAIQRALAYLHTQQNADGGFPYANPSPYGTDTDANSTAFVIQALVSVAQDPEGPAWTVNGRTPLTALWKLQLPSGALEWQAGFGENSLATYQAVPAFMLAPFPLARTTVGGPPALLPETGAGERVLRAEWLPSGLAFAAAALVGLGALLRARSLRPGR